MGYYRVEILRYAWRQGCASFVQQAILLGRHALGNRRFLVFVRYAHAKPTYGTPLPTASLRIQGYVEYDLIPESIRREMQANSRWLCWDTRKWLGQGWRLWVATIDDKLAGASWTREGDQCRDFYCQVGKRDAVIWATVILPAYRGQGIHRLLAHHMIEELRQAGKARIFRACREYNLPSRRNIERAGFTLIGAAREERRGRTVWTPVAHSPRADSVVPHAPMCSTATGIAGGAVCANPYARRGQLYRLLCLGASMLWYIPTRLVWSHIDRVVVLCYHGIKPHQAARFAWQVRRVAGRAIGVQALTAGSTRHRTTPAVCFTFDDAFANLLDHALPVLHAHRVPACVFAVSDNLGDRPRWSIEPDHPDAGEPVMTAAQLRQAAAGGLCVLGSHTCTHPPLTELAPAAVARELEESRRKLSELAGQPVDDLALPHGSFTPAMIEAAFAAGYQRVYTLEPRPHAGGDGRQVIGRFLMSPDAWRIEFLLTCAGAYSWLYPWRRLLDWLRGRRARPQHAGECLPADARRSPA